jgi:hypothetical protein
MALSADQSAWLAKLRAAREKLILGEQVASISSGGRTISLAQMSPDIALKKIEDEIALLEAADVGSGQVQRRGAIRFNW